MRARLRLAACLLAAATVVACSNPLGRQYEYDEQTYLAVDGSATVVVNSSLPALVALRGASLDPKPDGTADRDSIRQMYQSAGCTVDKVGVKKAIKALVRPIQDIADAIQRQDSKWLTTMPGVGASTAEKIVATLKRKVTRFALAPTRPAPSENGAAHEEPAAATAVEGDVLEEAYQALMALGHNPIDARNRLDRALATGKTFTSAEEVLKEIYNK